MGRSKKGFDRILRVLKHKDLALRLTRISILNALAKRLLPQESNNTCYVPINESIELPPGTVAPAAIIETFIREASDHLILSRCPCRNGSNCMTADESFGCTFLGPAVKEVHPEVGRLVSAEEALEHLHQATEMGLISCVGKFKGDAFMLGVKDHHRMMSICHCCSCCCITTAMPRASRDARNVFVKLEGVNVKTTDNCVGCGLCQDACVFRQITISDGKAVIGEECKGCGRCVTACPREGKKITIDNPGYMEDCMSRIRSMVDIN
jgi:hypothetical protein